MNVSPPPHRRGAVAIVVRQRRLLVIRRGSQVVAPGALCFPGGGIEAGETEADALQREVREELAVPVVPIDCVWRSTTDWGVEIAWWLAEMADDVSIVCNPAEVAEYFWLTPRELAERGDLLESNRRFLQAMADGEVAMEGLGDSSSA